jgi:hypothetical protein
MNLKENSDLKACWGILWRSLVFMPYMLAVFIVVGSIWLGRWFLPVCVGMLLYSGDWTVALIAVAFWLLAMRSYRRFRLSRFFEPPPSLL